MREFERMEQEQTDIQVEKELLHRTINEVIKKCDE